VGHQHGVVQIDLAALPDDPDLLQQMLREVVPELQAENEKLWQLIQRLLRHRYGPRSGVHVPNVTKVTLRNRSVFNGLQVGP